MPSQKYGCAIRTRIGLNKDDKGINEGIILLEIAAKKTFRKLKT
ncbi:MAG: hypothetical protein U5L09_15915 [Bacteroidales bacterium]|nr:hypothetical protein [Bacteroidales bacterium]